jgi:Uma2 family endonuclease
VTGVALREALVDEQLIADRERLGLDGRDEVWAGVYVMVPPARQPHQRTTRLLAQALVALGLAEVDLDVGVGHADDYRVPDVAVYDADQLDEQQLYVGRAKLVVEVVSPSENPHAKLAFYTERADEFLIVHPDRLELFTGGQPVDAVDGWLIGRTMAVRLEADGTLLVGRPDRSTVERITRP